MWWTVTKHARLWSLPRSCVVVVVLSAGWSAEASGELVTDFSLIDVNATSSTYGQPVSPRDYLEQISGWYFGNAT